MSTGLRIVCAFLFLLLPLDAFAQRELHWESVDVEARLDASGVLHVEEIQAMVFTGDWNGGERIFDIRRRQKLLFRGMSRASGSDWIDLAEDSALDDPDEYAFTDRSTLRWRSRRPSDPPFAGTVIRYRLRYELSGILTATDDGGFRLAHDFLFPDRASTVDRFSLRLSLDGVWDPKSSVRSIYTAEEVRPGDGFVLTIPLRYTGASLPAALDNHRSPEIVLLTVGLLAAAGLGVAWLFAREGAAGRFAPLPAVNESLILDHLLRYPAEVVAAAWDEDVGPTEVVTLLARLERERKLESEIGAAGALTLRLQVDRDELQGYERTLIDKLFFNNKTTTSTSQVKSHYRKQGFDPAREIAPGLSARVAEVLGPVSGRRPIRYVVMLLLLGAAALLLVDWTGGDGGTVATPVVGLGGLILAVIAWTVGTRFRSNIHWGRKRAAACLIPGLLAVSGAAAFLWFAAGPGLVDVTPRFAQGIALLALAVMAASIGGMRSMRSHSAIALRKKLAAGRAYFIAELQKAQPALRDDWLPWILAFGLGDRVDDWSAQQATSSVSGGSSRSSMSPTTSSFGSSSASSGWTGFSGGRSGGAGASASWAAAAGGMAAGVSPPSSGSSSGGGGSSSSSGGSSGGGGGGGW